MTTKGIAHASQTFWDEFPIEKSLIEVIKTIGIIASALEIKIPLSQLRPKSPPSTIANATCTMANPNIAIWTDVNSKIDEIDVAIARTMSEITIVVHRITSGQIRLRIEA